MSTVPWNLYIFPLLNCDFPCWINQVKHKNYPVLFTNKKMASFRVNWTRPKNTPCFNSEAQNLTLQFTKRASLSEFPIVEKKLSTAKFEIELSLIWTVLDSETQSNCWPPLCKNLILPKTNQIKGIQLQSKQNKKKTHKPQEKTRRRTWTTARATNCSSFRVSWCHNFFW